MFVYQTRGTNIVKNTVSIFSLIFVFLLVLPPVAELNPIYPLLLLRSCTGSSHSVRSPIGRICYNYASFLVKQMETDCLDTLLNTKFFTPCNLHPSLQTYKFCIDCSVSFCTNCTVHNHHRQVRIWRYSYHDVVRVQDMKYHFCCAGIQVSVNSKFKEQSIGTIIYPSPESINLSFKEKSSPETEAWELESTISVAESTEETQATSSSSRPRKRRRKGIPCRCPFFLTRR
ncbi:uncharacterized protein LOC111798456 isoform X2 [Cucurbita pepo subsp. pepo]|uniref:uncharacterized protein LOC111798456 isoform X2 n=1 Tax=Cucurbita pepo subsp. pepo TaxID=3664 RepID=UPI000C9D55F8|nr:uncharacterized protein LOC111798456 isoform X2 [Cucurbita pepo subsp. pepo]